MKLYILTTKSENIYADRLDYFTYLITHAWKPTNDEIALFLQHNAIDKEEDIDESLIINEQVISLIEVDEKNALLIPIEKIDYKNN